MNPFLAEIRFFAGNFAPMGWRFCDGSLLPISENETLFTLLGTTYGGDGMSNFALPDLRGRAPIGVGNSFVQGQQVGVEEVTLTVANLPAHTHTVTAKVRVSSKTADQKNPTGKYWAVTGAADKEYANAAAAGAYMADDLLVAETGISGGSAQPADNMQPYLVLNYIICTEGLYPTQN